MADIFVNIAPYFKLSLLLGTSLIILCWLSYFVRFVYQQEVKVLTSLYTSYIVYSVSILFWVLSNAYFHSSLLVGLGDDAGILMARAANIFSYMAFVCAFHFSCKVTSEYKNHQLPKWQWGLIGLATLYSVPINLMSGYTVIGIDITAQSDFILHFGSGTPLFFFTILLFFFLTLSNLFWYGLKKSQIKRLKVTYMAAGIIIFMISTTLVHLFATLILNDFSMTWLPPALSISELLFMGYAVVCNRFYSWRYLLHIGSSLALTLGVYFTFLAWSFDGFNMQEEAFELVLLGALMVTGTWRLTWKVARSISSVLIYGSIKDPTDKIAGLVDDFQTSTEQAMEKLAGILHVDKALLVLDANSNDLYSSVLNQTRSALLVKEVEYEVSSQPNTKLHAIRDKMLKSNTAMILPLHDKQDTLSYFIMSSGKRDGSLFTNEEISALQKLLKKAWPYIHNERKVQHSQAMAKSIAHEMRNPLAQVQLHLEKISELTARFPETTPNLANEEWTDLEAKLEQEINRGRDAIQRGNLLIDATLHEAHDLYLNQDSLGYYSVVELINKALDDYAYGSEAFTSRVQFEPEEQDYLVHANDTMFSFILFNLLRNALHYFDDYPKSYIEIKLKTGEKFNQILFKDYGPGIDPKVVERIFDDFFTHQKYDGSGLGLSYCKRVMTLFDGSIHCQSVYGKFTEFKLVFPKVASNVRRENDDSNLVDTNSLRDYLAGVQLPESSIKEGIQVLVTDDNKGQRALTRIYLEQLGAMVHEAENGLQAVKFVEKHPVDIVFMDIQMPVLDGLAATKQIKLLKPTLPVIALSGESGKREIDKINQLMDGRLSKPTSKQLLDKTIRQYF
ncbi:hybrid sensor histidine kinase/response regulator [Vibrio kagoshimensis]|uniref:hybrid sensor histidine kinase/response regulator n=1 Tax=Vibrio kagoshimensis TaxID=2910244 RepID=UPI003D1E25A6